MIVQKIRLLVPVNELLIFFHKQLRQTIEHVVKRKFALEHLCIMIQIMHHET